MLQELEIYPIQNWLITPAALAANENRPRDIHDQQWLLMLSGIVLCDARGKDQDEHNDPLPVTSMHFVPNFLNPCHHAISKYYIPRPPGNEDYQYRVQFEVEQACSTVAINHFTNYDADMAKFIVVKWEMGPFLSGFDMFNGAPINRIFNGLNVDVAVADHDTRVRTLSFETNLLGRIVFTQIRIE
jgi:hypothetical protein